MFLEGCEAEYRSYTETQSNTKYNSLLWDSLYRYQKSTVESREQAHESNLNEEGSFGTAAYNMGLS